jgi:hypothetical protein
VLERSPPSSPLLCPTLPWEAGGADSLSPNRIALNGLVPWPLSSASPRSAAASHDGGGGGSNGTYLFVYGAADSVVGVGRLTVRTS